MIQKKKVFTKDRLIFAAVCLVLDLIIIFVANRFLAFPNLSPVMQSFVRRSWMLMMGFALICSIAGVIVSKSYDMARAYFLEGVILVVCGFWFGVSRDAICTTAPTASQLWLFSTAHICLTIAMIIFQIDMILNHPLKALYSGKMVPAGGDVSALPRSQKIALAETLTRDIQNSRGSDDFLKESAADHTPKPIKKTTADKETEPFVGVSAISVTDMKNDKAVMHRQNKRYDVSIDSEDESAALKNRTASAAGKSDKTPIRPKGDQKKAVLAAKPAGTTEKKVVMDKPKAEPLKPVAAQVDKSAYKKSQRPAEKSEWDPMKVARESEQTQKRQSTERAAATPSDVISPDKTKAAGKPQINKAVQSAPQNPKTSEAVKSSAKRDGGQTRPSKAESAKASKPFSEELREATKPGADDLQNSDGTPKTKKSKAVTTAGISAQSIVPKATAQSGKVRKTKKDVSKADSPKMKQPTKSQPTPDAQKTEMPKSKTDRKTAKPGDGKTAAPQSTEKEIPKQQKRNASAYDHIDIAWADPKPVKRGRKKRAVKAEEDNRQ